MDSKQIHLTKIFAKKFPCCNYKQCIWNWQCLAVKDPKAKTLGKGHGFLPAILFYSSITFFFQSRLV